MISIKGIQISAALIFAVPFLATVSLPRKAMIYFYLLALMFAFGIPQANAANCDVNITVNYTSDEYSAFLRKILVKRDRKNKKWRTAYDYNKDDGILLTKNLEDDGYYDTMNVTKKIDGDNCKHQYRVRVLFTCGYGQRQDEDKTITTGAQKSLNSDVLNVTVALACPGYQLG